MHKNFLFSILEHEIISVLEPIPTIGLTEHDGDDLKQKVYNVMMKEYEKLKYELDKDSKDPQWLNQKRPRLVCSF